MKKPLLLAVLMTGTLFFVGCGITTEKTWDISDNNTGTINKIDDKKIENEEIENKEIEDKKNEETDKKEIEENKDNKEENKKDIETEDELVDDIMNEIIWDLEEGIDEQATGEQKAE